MSFWSDKVWDDRVHQLLGENLHYFLVQVRPFAPKKVQQRLNLLLSQKEPGSVRAFAIFGSSDLLIRAWLHPSALLEFQRLLKESLENFRALYPFSVTNWDSGSEEDPAAEGLLEDLDEGKIRAVQSDRSRELLDQLRKVNLVRVQEPLEKSIRFFVAVNLGNITQEAQEGVVTRIRTYLAGIPDIQRLSIYSGYGFCSILLEAQTLNYFCIPDIPNWIGAEYLALDASTETFLVHSPEALAGSEVIGRSTFQAIGGTNLFVQSIIPDVYDVHPGDSRRHEDVKALLLPFSHENDLKPRDKTLLRDYLLPYLDDDPAGMARTIFTFFAELEGFLRKRAEEFTGRQGLTVKEVCASLRIEKGAGKFFTLDHLLNICSTAIRHAGGEGPSQKDWAPLVELRNRVAHGNYDFAVDWEQPVKTLIAGLPKIHKLTAAILEVIPLAEGESMGDYL